MYDTVWITSMSSCFQLSAVNGMCTGKDKREKTEVEVFIPLTPLCKASMGQTGNFN